MTTDLSERLLSLLLLVALWRSRLRSLESNEDTKVNRPSGAFSLWENTADEGDGVIWRFPHWLLHLKLLLADFLQPTVCESDVYFIKCVHDKQDGL